MRKCWSVTKMLACMLSSTRWPNVGSSIGLAGWAASGGGAGADVRRHRAATRTQ
jgi:hypothetical protein